MQRLPTWSILLFDLAMLFLSARLCGFSGCLITTLALMSSFGPCVALAALGSTLQNTFAAGNRVLDILEESPVVEEVTGQPEVEFSGAASQNVSFAYQGEPVLGRTCRLSSLPIRWWASWDGPDQAKARCSSCLCASGRCSRDRIRILGSECGPDQYSRSSSDGELCHAGDPFVPRQHPQ